jgi:hypothetical protein
MQVVQRFLIKRLPVSLVSLLLLTTVAACVAAPARVAQVEAITDIAMGIPQQDVYVEREDGMLYRVHQDDLTEAILAQTAYATTENTWPDVHELSDNPRGPYPKGEALDFTFGEWIGATGNVEYIKYASGIDGVRIDFQNLRPDSVYTVWCVLSWPPPNAAGFELPCGAPDGSQSVFHTDATGNLNAYLLMSAMPYSTQERASILCFAYHSDGQTHGHVVGNYGQNAHVHLCVDVPPVDSELWETKSVVSPAGVLTQ